MALLLVMGVFHVAMSGQTASYLLFGATQLGALVGGVLMLQRGQPLIRVVVLLAGLYSIWLCGGMFLLKLR
jgi:hypothetical protein